MFPVFDGMSAPRSSDSRGNCDVFSVVDLHRDGEESSSKPTGNVVVDTLRIVTGIPQSRMTDILEEKSPVPDGSEDAEALL